MSENNSTVAELGERLVKILDELMVAGDWDSSLFLRTSSKRLQELRDEAQRFIVVADGANKAQEVVQVNERLLAPGYARVYISLYQVACKNLQDWLNVLMSLESSHSITRPTYADEACVRQLVRSKTDIDRNGYAIVDVRVEDVYDFEQTPLDAAGNPLLVLKEGAVKLAHIVEFVRANKDRYMLQDNKLVYIGNVGE